MVAQLAAVCGLLFAAAAAQQAEPDLAELSIEDLMNVEVTSAGKKEQKLATIPAAIYVVTQEDIRRSGSTNLPEVLRLVPGVEVAQISGSSWAVSIRGFNSLSASKLLVMIDGRSLYLPTFSGVYWDMHDIALEDVERVEVIRGPGAALWGANAVNGVINVITKSAAETQGALISVAGGDYERAFATVRYGSTLGSTAKFRVYTKYTRGSGLPVPGDGDAPEQWDSLRGGFRVDWPLSPRDSLLLTGDVFHGRLDMLGSRVLLTPPFVQDVTAENVLRSGGHLLARWSHRLAGGSEIAIQGFYDRTRRGDILQAEQDDIFDFDFQHHIHLGTRHDVVWGLSHRSTDQRTQGGLDRSFTPPNQTLNQFSSFAQDEITLIGSRLFLTLGSKFDHNSFTGWEVLPNARLLWMPHAKHTLWAAVSRAVRTPGTLQRSARISPAAFLGPGGTVNLLAVLGSSNAREENLLAYEIGYRVQPSRRLSFDIAGFYNFYQHLASLEPGVPFFESSPPPPHLVIPLQIGNRLRGETYGLEFTATYTPFRSWKLIASHSWLRGHLRSEPGQTGVTSFFLPGDNPEHQFHLSSYLSLPHQVEVDSRFSAIGELSDLGVPAYVRLDTRLAWRPVRSLEWSLVAQNLLDDRHIEFLPRNQESFAREIKRGFYGKVTWRF